MARLPNPGGDDGIWGDILNDFLSTEHNSDGTQKTLGVAKGGTGGTSASAARTNLGAMADTDARLTDNRTPTDGSVTDVKVSNTAAIAESKLNLASDAAAGVASRRTLGTGSTQAAAGSDLAALDTRVDAVENDRALKSETPTIEELIVSAHRSSISATTPVSMFVCPFPLVLRSAAIATGSGSIAVSDTNYWFVDVRYHRGASINNQIAWKTTAATGGQAVAAKTAWTFDDVAFPAVNLQKDDVVDFGFTRTGTPSNWTDLSLTLRYEPL